VSNAGVIIENKVARFYGSRCIGPSKDKIKMRRRLSWATRIPCKNCPSSCIGETSRKPV